MDPRLQRVGGGAPSDSRPAACGVDHTRGKSRVGALPGGRPRMGPSSGGGSRAVASAGGGS